MDNHLGEISLSYMDTHEKPNKVTALQEDPSAFASAQSDQSLHWERSGSVVECLTRDRDAAVLSLTGITALCPWARHINPSLVLVQPRKTLPFITERLLMGLQNQIKQTNTH